MKEILQLSVSERMRVYLLHYVLSLAYILSYPAAQASSPSLTILLFIRHSMPQGVTKEDISSFLRNQSLEHRINDLISENLVREKKDGRLEPTKKGHLLLKMFILFRKAYGLPIGKG